jgi:hypothetical protein
MDEVDGSAEPLVKEPQQKDLAGLDAPGNAVQRDGFREKQPFKRILHGTTSMHMISQCTSLQT